MNRCRIESVPCVNMQLEIMGGEYSSFEAALRERKNSLPSRILSLAS